MDFSKKEVNLLDRQRARDEAEMVAWVEEAQRQEDQRCRERAARKVAKYLRKKQKAKRGTKEKKNKKTKRRGKKKIPSQTFHPLACQVLGWQEPTWRGRAHGGARRQKYAQFFPIHGACLVVAEGRSIWGQASAKPEAPESCGWTFLTIAWNSQNPKLKIKAKPKPSVGIVVSNGLLARSLLGFLLCFLGRRLLSCPKVINEHTYAQSLFAGRGAFGPLPPYEDLAL